MRLSNQTIPCRKMPVEVRDLTHSKVLSTQLTFSNSDAGRRFNTDWQRLLRQYRAIAVIRARELSLGIGMGLAAAQGGIKLIEVTWNSDRPANLVAQLREQLPDCWIGVGTILSASQLTEAIASGAQFAFSPHVNLDLIKVGMRQGVPYVPGALTPSEIVQAWQAGSSAVKVYPASALGGVNYLKSLQGPLEHIPLIPTGGVRLDNVVAFLEAGAIALGLSQELFPTPLVNAQDWSAIAQRAQQLCHVLHPFTSQSATQS